MKNLKLYFIILFLFAFYTSKCQNNFCIKGIVKDSVNRIALSSVAVISDELGYISETGKHGTFSIPATENKIFNIRFSMQGYKTKYCKLKADCKDTIVIFISPSIIEMDELTITATRFATKIKESPVLTQIISSKELSLAGSTQIATALSNAMPGLDFYNEGSGMTFTMQGIESKYTLFLIDGERMAGENHDNIDYYRLGSSNIEKIEIVKGASSTLYGSNAIGGVVNLITRTPVKPFEMNLYGRVSKFSELESGLNFGFRKNKFSSFTDVSRKSTDGYDLTPETSDLYTLEPYTLYNAFQKFTYKANSKLSFILKGSCYSRERFDVSDVPVHPLYSDYNGSFTTNYKVNEHLDITATYHGDRYESHNILEKLDNQKKSIYYDIQHTGRIIGKYFNTYDHIIKKQSLITGVEMFSDKMFSERIEDSTREMKNYNIFILDEIKINNHFTAIGGIRYDNYSSVKSSLSPKVSLMYSIGKFNYRATYGYGFRVPSIKEQYYDFDLGFISVKGNDSLRPEHSKYASFSVEYNHKKNNASANVYFNRVDDMIHDVLLANTTNSYTYINLNKVNVSGIDLLQHFNINKNFSISAGYSYTYAYDMIKKEELGGVCKNSGVAGIEYSWKLRNYKGMLSFNGKIYGKKTFENYDAATYSYYTDTYPSYSLWRATLAQYFYNHSVELSLGITNIFDYRNNTDLINIDPGRRFFCMLIISIDKLYEQIKNK
ncbi:MAG TPA: TonB-dependent receptor [Bacteroidales bacterium]|nr:TonB-dependent receptor [Bacteroidales bacterium]HPS16080.1 TonB-dependent receptor [Bacteroidales bacterium]